VGGEMIVDELGEKMMGKVNDFMKWNGDGGGG